MGEGPGKLIQFVLDSGTPSLSILIALQLVSVFLVKPLTALIRQQFSPAQPGRSHITLGQLVLRAVSFGLLWLYLAPHEF